MSHIQILTLAMVVLAMIACATNIMNRRTRKMLRDVARTLEQVDRGDVRANFNDLVKVRVTPVGMDLRRSWYARLGLTPPELEIDAEGYTSMPLHEVALVFGRGMFNGGEPPVEMEFILTRSWGRS